MIDLEKSKRISIEMTNLFQRESIPPGDALELLGTVAAVTMAGSVYLINAKGIKINPDEVINQFLEGIREETLDVLKNLNERKNGKGE